MRLVDQTSEGLVNYTCAQIAHFFPDGREQTAHREITRNLAEALDRLSHCINAVKMWRPGEFYYLHSTQYCQYLYYLANTIWRNDGDKSVCTQLFCLNKALNGIDCFYEIKLPEIFFIGHSVGIVLAKADYANYLVLYQNSTVGKGHGLDYGVAPVLEEGVVMYAGSAIIGRCLVAKNTVLSQGVSLINRDTPGDCLVYAGGPGKPIFAPPMKNVLEDFFRL